MKKLTSRKKHKVKPVYQLTKYFTNILNTLSTGNRMSVNEIFEELRKSNEKGLKFKRDFLDAIQILQKNQIIKISTNASQRYEVEFDHLGYNLISLMKNIKQAIEQYDELKNTIQLKGKLIDSRHKEWLEEATSFIIETLFIITLALSSSYIKLAFMSKDSDAAKAILNDIFASTLKQGLSLPNVVNGQEILMKNVIAQLDQPVMQYIVDNMLNRSLAENKIIGGKINVVINSIYSIVEPGKNVNNFPELVHSILSVKKSNVFPTRSVYIPPST